MIDNKTQRLQLPLPDVDNYLEDDVARLQQSLHILDNAATVGSDGKIPIEQLPAVAITDTFPVDSEAEMLALVAEPGDVAIRVDVSKSFILMAEPASVLGNWKELVNDAVIRLTPLIRESLRRSYAEAGYNLVDGSFGVGGTIATATDVLLYDATGAAYSWHGDIPYTVPDKSSPASTGGVSPGAWQDKSDATLSEKLAPQNKYQSANIIAGAVTINANTARYWGVLLDQNITSLSLLGVESHQADVIDVIFSQPPTGSKSVSIPASVKLSHGTIELASTGPGDITLVRFTSVNSGTTWLASVIGVFDGPVPFTLPVIQDNNATFNDEATNAGLWTPTGGTAAIIGDSIRFTKTAASGTGFSAVRTLTMPPSGKDWIFYGRVRASVGNGYAFWMENAVVDKLYGFWLNATNLGIPAPGQVSCTAWNGSTRTGATLATGVNTESTHIEFAMQFDSKWQTLSCFFKEADGLWQLKGRVACSDITPVRLSVRSLSDEAAGTWAEFDFLTVARPNIIVIGDSHAEGKTLYSPNPALGLSNYDSTWQRYAKIYQSLRNNLIVNKAVGGETSTATLARISDATGQGARVVFLHASSNDSINSVSHSARTTNISSMVSAIKASAAEAVLLNALYATSDSPYNPAHRDYCKGWWNANATGVGAFTTIDIMAPISDSNGFVSSELTQSDAVHLTPAGYKRVGEYLSR